MVFVFNGFDTEEKDGKGSGGALHVGTILLQLPLKEGEQNKIPAIRIKHPPKKLSTETERRDVYVDEQRFSGEPYYCTQTGNHVLVVNQSRIEYFPEMDPQSRAEKKRRELEEAQRQQAEAERKERERLEAAAAAMAAKSAVVKIGTIVVQPAIPRESPVVAEKMVLDVYGSRIDAEEPITPYMLTNSGKKIKVKDRSQIRFSRAEEEEERLEEERRAEEALGLIGKYVPGLC